MLAACVIIFMTPVAHSELLVYEPFDYPVGELVGNGGAFGLDSGWENWGMIQPAQVGQDSLLHPIYEYELDPMGNHAVIVEGDVAATFLTSLADDGRDYWVSFLYQRIAPDSYGWFTFLFPDNNNDPTVGIEINGGYPGMYDPWTTVSGVTDPAAVMWIVIKAETSGSHTSDEMVYMWVDPEPITEPDIAEAGGSLEYTIPKDGTCEFFLMGGIGDPAAYSIDEIKIGTSFNDVSVIPKCENASNPLPGNGQQYVDINLSQLSWDPPTCVDDPAYDVYLGTDPNFASPEAEQIAETSYTLTSSLDYETTYYWRIDTVDSNESGTITYEGRTWRFTTWAINPTIITQPASTTVPAGSDVQLSVEAVNTESYEWYFADTPDGAGTLIPDSDSPILDLTDVQLADEDYYYCKTINSEGETDSERARLLIERPLAHWKFENNLEDEVDPINDGTATGYIDFDTGIDGQAVAVVDANFITTSNDMGQLTEITISMWISPDASVEEQEQALLAANGTWDPGTVYINIDEDQVYGQIIEDEETSIVAGPALITQGMWHHCVFVYDTSTEFSGLYLNGQLIDEETTSVAPILPPLSIGAISTEDGLPYSGLIDDLRIYDYRLSDLEIASLYTNFLPDAKVCLGNPEYDTSGNCQVDLEDLELLLSQWLECNIVPTCLP
jgi:hypothetical protein